MCLQQRGENVKKVAAKNKTQKTKKKAKIKGLEEYKDDELDLDEDYEELDLEDEEEVEEKPKKKKKSTRRKSKKQLEENPPINEKMIEVMMSSMGRKPSQKQVNQMLKQMNKNM